MPEQQARTTEGALLATAAGVLGAAGGLAAKIGLDQVLQSVHQLSG
jgi:hypothetical protein